MEFGGGFTHPTPGCGSAGFVMCRWQKLSHPERRVVGLVDRLMFDSNAINAKYLPLVVGLVNCTGEALSSWSATGLLIDPGQVNL